MTLLIVGHRAMLLNGPTGTPSTVRFMPYLTEFVRLYARRLMEIRSSARSLPYRLVS